MFKQLFKYIIEVFVFLLRLFKGCLGCLFLDIGDWLFRAYKAQDLNTQTFYRGYV